MCPQIASVACLLVAATTCRCAPGRTDPTVGQLYVSEDDNYYYHNWFPVDYDETVPTTGDHGVRTTTTTEDHGVRTTTTTEKPDRPVVPAEHYYDDLHGEPIGGRLGVV